MERNKYLTMCQMCAGIYETLGGMKQNVPDALKVKYKMGEYYPIAYQLSFDKHGKAVHTAVLHSVNTNSVTYANLEGVEKYV